MFGVLRTILALMVLVYHLFGGDRPLGTYAVFGFYVISGYLMTLIMHESYGYTPAGRTGFAINRALRLLPQYWAALLLAVVLNLVYGEDLVRGFNEVMVLPRTWKTMFCNAFILFPAWHGFDIRPRLVPSTWAVTVEMFFYALICLGLSRTFTRVKLWVAASACYFIGTYLAGWDWQDRYFPVAAASLPFSLGAGVYFLSREPRVRDWFAVRPYLATALFAAMLIHCGFWMTLHAWNVGPMTDLGVYLNLALFAVLVCSLASGASPLPISKSLDKQIGDLSYPIYLLHWQVGLVVSQTMFGEAFHEVSWRGLASLIVSILACVALSWLSARAIDAPIEQLRQRFKSGPHPDSAVSAPARYEALPLAPASAPREVA